MQIFTNADKVHAAQVLKRLDLEDCFEGVICFETLNCVSLLHPGNTQEVTHKNYYQNQVLKELDDGTGTNDDEDDDDNSSFSPKFPILCKPLVEAIEAAIQIANIVPERTVIMTLSTFLHS